MKKMRRIDALKAGLSRYFTGEKCGRGHLSERRTGNGACVRCMELDWQKKYGPRYREARKQYAQRMRAIYNDAKEKNAAAGG